MDLVALKGIKPSLYLLQLLQNLFQGSFLCVLDVGYIYFEGHVTMMYLFSRNLGDLLQIFGVGGWTWAAPVLVTGDPIRAVPP